MQFFAISFRYFVYLFSLCFLEINLSIFLFQAFYYQSFFALCLHFCIVRFYILTHILQVIFRNWESSLHSNETLSKRSYSFHYCNRLMLPNFFSVISCFFNIFTRKFKTVSSAPTTTNTSEFFLTSVHEIFLLKHWSKK